MDSEAMTTADHVPKDGDPPPARSRCRSCVRGFLAFLFSTVGLTFLLICYSVVGGLVFMRLESANENRTAAAEWRRNRTADEMRRLRREHLSQLWNMTISLNVFYPDSWMLQADDILQNYTTLVYKYTKVMGWDGGGQDDENQWSFAGSLLYAITVITTIGTPCDALGAVGFITTGTRRTTFGQKNEHKIAKFSVFDKKTTWRLFVWQPYKYLLPAKAV